MFTKIFKNIRHIENIKNDVLNTFQNPKIIAKLGEIVNFAPLNVHTSTKYIDLDGALQKRFGVRISFTDTGALIKS